MIKLPIFLICYIHVSCDKNLYFTVHLVYFLRYVKRRGTAAFVRWADLCFSQNIGTLHYKRILRSICCFCDFCRAPPNNSRGLVGFTVKKNCFIKIKLSTVTLLKNQTTVCIFHYVFCQVCSYRIKISLNQKAMIEIKDVESLRLRLIFQALRCPGLKKKRTVDFLAECSTVCLLRDGLE